MRGRLVYSTAWGMSQTPPQPPPPPRYNNGSSAYGSTRTGGSAMGSAYGSTRTSRAASGTVSPVGSGAHSRGFPAAYIDSALSNHADENDIRRKLQAMQLENEQLRRKVRMLAAT